MHTEPHTFPHIRDRASVPKMMWTVILALLPATGVFLFFSGPGAIKSLLTTLASCLVAEKVTRTLLKSPSRLYDGSAVITALLLALLLPASLPAWTVALGSLAAIVLGKEIFGGLGQNPFNPALVGIVFLTAFFPLVRGVFALPQEPLVEKAMMASLLAGGLVVLVTRTIDWEIPLFYLGAAGVGSWFLGQSSLFLLPPFVLGAFFLVTDPVTSPLARASRRGAALTAGLLTAALRPFMSQTEALTYALLLVNGLNPWLERWFQFRQ